MDIAVLAAFGLLDPNDLLRAVDNAWTFSLTTSLARRPQP